ncbi:MAG: DUF1285 domain-containing protein [Ancylobacter novellus]|uniref:DUF1285 domain-containing protein n=1 Tax=Ancylobacter novellus TaxID=921 RepID=A0A2W5QY72_ANCNO|nr:MAG: DUF1285 domain-containing protein [Ancylobacter novellus]
MGSEASARFDELMRAVGDTPGRALPPIERWNPPDCGEIDIRIDREGAWHHEGRPIRRPALVRLFASVLRREGERYELVTPVEKLAITVEDAPFLAVDMAVEEGEGGPVLVFRTNLDDLVRCDEAHPLRFDPQPGSDEVRPYIYVRRGLWARLTRPVFLDLAERVEERHVEGRAMFGVASAGVFFPLAPVDTAEGMP